MNWTRRRPEIEFYWNLLAWEWRTFTLEHCVVRHRGPMTITTFRAWAAWVLR